MKSYYGNYLGIVITGGEKDPEGRGRCQIFVPHVLPALYDGWNREGEDINFAIIGEGLPEGLDPEIVTRLQKMLPWAECAAPIIGASPSVKNGSEATRNIALQAGSTGVAAGAYTALGGTPEENAAYASLTTEAAKQSYAAGKCGTAVGEILESVYGYSEAQIRAGSSTGRRDGKEYDRILSSLGWKAVSVSSPADAPANSILSYGAVPGNQYGHVEYVGINSSGNKAYYFGLGGTNGVSSPGGGSRVSARNTQGFKGIAWVPPTEVTNAALAKLGQSGINPSIVPSESGINLKSDGSDPALQTAAASTTEASSGSVLPAFSGFANELNDPSVKSRLFNLMEAEVGSQGTDAQLAWLETVRNRAAIRGVSINTIISDQAYYEPYKNGGTVYNNAASRLSSNSSKVNTYSGLLSQALGGSNITNGATHNASAGVAASVKSGGYDSVTGSVRDIGGETYYSKTFEQNKLTQLLSTEGLNTAPAASSLDSQLPDTNSVVQNPTPFRMQSGPPTNNQARGMFGYASEGTTVWVFFREGNPMYPVYFAASYGQREWQNMYQYASEGIGAGKGGQGAKPGTEMCDMRLYGGGQRSLQITDESGLDPDFVHQVYGQNGSNLTFMKDHTEFNSIYDHVSRVLGDHHDITEANREVRVRGDQNAYYEQDVYVTIGNWSADAVAASDEIQDIINEAMEIKTSKGKA